MKEYQFVWVFLSAGAAHSGGVFSQLIEAENWIKSHALSGVLTKYPVGVGVWEWAVELEYFAPKSEKHHDSKFVGGFTTAAMEHFHYESGVRTD